MDTEVPYEREGRTRQKSRTRKALVTAAQTLLADGLTPTVEQAAAAAGISRTTAYRYFPNQRGLLVAAHPEIDMASLLPPDAPTDVRERLDLVMRQAIRITVEWEPALRTSLRLSLEPDQSERPLLRRGRAIGWIEEALEPLRATTPHVDPHRLACAIRSATGIEAFLWLVDIAGMPRAEAAETLLWTSKALLEAAVQSTPAMPEHRRKGGH
ncbi:TetR/AcrR family transcriptional regulator [Antrihabitans stalactiti]|uniref:TetR/AcrR family transcriptional regulator n=1 Tax=Antrihabitans stalactiti TaxID=2584121 RepID=A0A848KG09_9NOCA|nr:TetR/AcrR family transcriptional regulator [Antrihabitans stalactiti]NMN97121.1 TetR/AcrR family transcriptional regulator [Antrihabitans stalactiti]